MGRATDSARRTEPPSCDGWRVGGVAAREVHDCAMRPRMRRLSAALDVVPRCVPTPYGRQGLVTDQIRNISTQVHPSEISIMSGSGPSYPISSVPCVPQRSCVGTALVVRLAFSAACTVIRVIHGVL